LIEDGLDVRETKAEEESFANGGRVGAKSLWFANLSAFFDLGFLAVVFTWMGVKVNIDF